MNKIDPQTVHPPGRELTSKAQESTHLELKQKVLEIIALTPEVRNEKVQVIKELVAKGSYRVNYPQLALNLIVDHFLMAGRVPCQPETERQNQSTDINASRGDQENPEMILCSK
jgi:anti-sigma28 factor (negative regulator of flagellin synthesis)